MPKYDTTVIREDRATLGSDPSALTAAYSMGRHLYGVALLRTNAGARKR